MYPIAVIGPLEISLYKTLRAIAAVVMIGALLLRLRRGRWPITTPIFLRGSIWLLVGMIGGSLLETLLPALIAWATQGVPPPPGWWGEGRWLGALGGASLVGYLYCRQHDLPVGRMFDLFAVPLPLALAVARVGCLLRGCCGGREATTWPAMFLPDMYGTWANRYPTQLADVLANLFIFVLLVALERYALRKGATGWPFDGFLYLLFAELHLGQRFLIEFWRADTPRLIGALSWQQFLCASGMALATWLLVREFLRRRER